MTHFCTARSSATGSARRADRGSITASAAIGLGIVGVGLQPRCDVFSAKPQVLADGNGAWPDPLVPPRIDGLGRDLEEVGELAHGEQAGERYRPDTLCAGTSRAGQDRLRGVHSGGRSI